MSIDKATAELAKTIADLIVASWRESPPEPVGMTDTCGAARFYNRKPKTLELMRRRGGGPRHSVFGKKCVRYSYDDLRAYADAHATDPENPLCGGREDAS